MGAKRSYTPGPWKWTGGVGCGPQLEGSNEYPGMNPILVTFGCGNDSPTDAGVKGCMPEKLYDSLRACPLHPTKADRALIAAAPDLLETLMALERTAGIAAPRNDPVRVRARAVIDRARGKK